VPRSIVTETSSPSAPLTGTLTRYGPARNAGRSSPSHSMRRPAAEVVIVGVGPGTPGVMPSTDTAIMTEAVDVRASWKPTPILLAADGLVPSPQAAAVTLVAYIDTSIVCNVRRLSCVPT
jgi:hypothetical protein